MILISQSIFDMRIDYFKKYLKRSVFFYLFLKLFSTIRTIKLTTVRMNRTEQNRMFMIKISSILKEEEEEKN